MKQPNFKNILYDYLVKHSGNIDYDVFSYGYAALVNYFLYTIITLPCALFMGLFTEILTFLFFFIPLRRYIGGYHFNSKLLCLIFSVFFSLSISYLSNLVELPFFVRLVTLIIMIILTASIKAVDNPNKRISVKEKLLYTKKSLIIEILYSILILATYNKVTYLYLNIAYFSTVFCVVGILIARLKSLRYNNMSKEG